MKISDVEIECIQMARSFAKDRNMQFFDKIETLHPKVAFVYVAIMTRRIEQDWLQHMHDFLGYLLVRSVGVP